MFRSGWKGSGMSRRSSRNRLDCVAWRSGFEKTLIHRPCWSMGPEQWKQLEPALALSLPVENSEVTRTCVSTSWVRDAAPPLPRALVIPTSNHLQTNLYPEPSPVVTAHNLRECPNFHHSLSLSSRLRQAYPSEQMRLVDHVKVKRGIIMLVIH